ncbi:PHP domain-containing protein [Gordonia sp. HY002]|uniref:PHP domain-containing protein n=1 Tax=Gordonia zhenghanii TaxID=2911516 RepID=UPI001EF0C37F|nr:PHP domain-containing protein [Gordonia zhenghanii]MCF8568925.1 PHP domain-containing protein [Gordonia zhenghanii]MCF8603020.1 PHP domain-containing protein [Gordonia zhenghanii]
MLTADLHTHTRFSDGTDTPEELLAAAQAAGLTTVGLTDHDTADGWDQAAEHVPSGMRVLPGAEFSTKHPGGDGALVSVHLLGYLFDRDHPLITAEWQRIVDERTNRGARIVESLVAAGYPISLEQVRDRAGRGNIGRPHIARALVDAGVIGSVGEAFEGILEDGGPHHVSLRSTSLVDGITMIVAAGGVPVIAHPRARTAAAVLSAPVLETLVDVGLAGLEVRHPDHDDAARAELMGIASDLGLITTGSSDYHGGNKTLRIGQERTDDDVVEKIVDRGAIAPFAG